MQSLPDPTHSAGGHSTDIARCSPEARSDDDTVAARRQQEFEQSPRHARGSNCGGVTVEVHDLEAANLGAGSVLAALHGESSQYPASVDVAGLVREAEVVVIYGNPSESRSRK